MTPNYPSAHSMDTYWFAVDQEGNVAFFDSDENGAVPEQALSYEEEIWITFESFEPETFSFNGSDLEKEKNCLHPCLIREDPETTFFSGGYYNVLLKGTNREIFNFLKVEGRSFIAFSSEEDPSSFYVYLRDLERKTAQTIHGLNLCTGCWVTYSLEWWRLGFFEYELNGFSLVPYKRQSIPKTPIKIQDLPPRLWRIATKILFHHLYFKEKEEIQPLEHFQCRTWGGGDWLDTQGNWRNA
jgi:hypothetical protein